jgi:hypothetical protein
MTPALRAGSSILPLRRGERRRPTDSHGKGFRRYAAAFQELADLRYVILGQAVVIAMKDGFLPSERHFDPVAASHVDIRAQRGQGMFRVLEVDIGADGMSEEAMQDFAVVMIHLNLKLMLPFRTGASLIQAVKTSMTHVNTRRFAFAA